MTHNQMIKCQYCNTHIRLRFTVGNNDIPFNILCPECKTEINGTIIINQEKPLKEDGKLNIHYDITNGIVDNDYSSTNKHFVAEQSIEFPAKKIFLYQNNQEPTPYIRAASIFGKDTISIIQRINEFLHFIENEWNNTKTLYNFYHNRQYDLLKNHLKAATDIIEINNELDMLMVLHQNLVISFNKILPNTTLNEYTTTANKVFNLYSSKQINLLNFINYLEDQDIFKGLGDKQLDILDDFCKIYLKLMPAITLKITNKEIDYDKYGISTVGYEELKNFYSKTYEYILTYLDIIIGLNNLEIREDYNNVLSNSYKINKFTDLNSINSKYNKINLIDIKEPYSKVIHLENRIRLLIILWI